MKIELPKLLATYKVAQGKYDETLDCLEAMLYHVQEELKSKPGDKFDSLFLDQITNMECLPNLGEFHSLSLHNDAWYTLNNKLTQSRYDPIREMPRFKAIVKEPEVLAE